MPGFHDSARRTGDDQPVSFGHRFAKSHRLSKGRLVRPGPGGTEHRYLATGTVRRKNLEGVSQLAKRTAENLQVAAAGLVLSELVGRLLDHADQVTHAV